MGIADAATSEIEELKEGEKTVEAKTANEKLNLDHNEKETQFQVEQLFNYELGFSRVM